MAASFQTPMSSPPPVATAAEAEQLASHFLDVMDKLADVVRQETELVRLGKLAQAAQVSQAKADLTHLYLADALRLRANNASLARIIPQQLAELRRRHDAFRALLQINLTVLATAHAVSEGIVRGVSGELARKSMPQTYGASGRALEPPRHTGAPLAVSRTL